MSSFYLKYIFTPTVLSSSADKNATVKKFDNEDDNISVIITKWIIAQAKSLHISTRKSML